MFDKIAEAILGNYPDNSQARELEILCRILALIILGAVIYLFTEEEDSDPGLTAIEWGIDQSSLKQMWAQSSEPQLNCGEPILLSIKWFIRFLY